MTTETAPDLPAFDRGLSKSCMQELRRLADPDVAEGAWWREALLHPDLIVAIRKDALNVYYRGGSVFEASFDQKQNRMAVRTHAKYLVRNQQNYASLRPDGEFSPIDALWRRFEFNKTLVDMMQAARVHAGPEKTGLHYLVRNASNVIDLELALWGIEPPAASAGGEATDPDTWEAIDTAENPKQRRLDVVSIERINGKARLTFHEAKHFDNKELRDKGPTVISQLQKYEHSLRTHEASLVDSYVRVCAALVEVEHLRSGLRNHLGKPGPKRGMKTEEGWNLICRVGKSEIPLVIDPLPRLVVFGFDQDQRDGKWKKHGGKLKERLPPESGAKRTYFVGNSRNSFKAFDYRPA